MALIELVAADEMTPIRRVPAMMLPYKWLVAAALGAYRPQS